MAVVSYRVSVTDVPTLLLRGGAKVSYAAIRNGDAANSIAFGAVDVTYAGGYLLEAKDVNNITVTPGTELYGRASTGVTVVAHIIHQS